MVKHLVFLRWLLIFAITFLSSYFCWKFGLFAEIMEKDWSYISVSIYAVFLLTTLWCGIKTFLFSRNLNHCLKVGVEHADVSFLEETKNQEEIGWFIAEQFTTWGFIGTVVGIVYALNGFIGVDVTNSAALQKLISDLVFGMSTALYTTLSGLVCSFFLKLQYINLGHARRKVDND